jgi:HEAT repeat protein
MKTYDEVKNILSAIEPTDGMYEKLSEEDIPNLQKLLKEPEPWLAARSVFALSKLKTERANELLYHLTDDPRVEIRVSLASAASELPSDISQKITGKLMEDREPGVRKFAYGSVSPHTSPDLFSRLKKALEKEELPHLQEIIREKISQFH